MSEPKAVYAAICAVAKAMSAEGIAKDRNNQAQGFKFRGIDDVYNALSGPMADAGLVMLPRCLSRKVDERQASGGKPLFYVTIECEFDLVAASDGSTHTIRTYGEAMDSADKATNKAMSAAYKYAAMQAFCIPTEGDNDADAHTHQPEPRRAQPPTPSPRTASSPAPVAAEPFNPDAALKALEPFGWSRLEVIAEGVDLSDRGAVEGLYRRAKNGAKPDLLVTRRAKRMAELKALGPEWQDAISTEFGQPWTWKHEAVNDIKARVAKHNAGGTA